MSKNGRMYGQYQPTFRGGGLNLHLGIVGYSCETSIAGESAGAGAASGRAFTGTPWYADRPNPLGLFAGIVIACLIPFFAVGGADDGDEPPRFAFLMPLLLLIGCAVPLAVALHDADAPTSTTTGTSPFSFACHVSNALHRAGALHSVRSTCARVATVAGEVQVQAPCMSHSSVVATCDQVSAAVATAGVGLAHSLGYCVVLALSLALSECL